MKFSIIIPVYNRPQEIQELLQSLLSQIYTNFEVIVVEDGSNTDAREIVESFQEQLDVRYSFIANRGQGFARNHGFERATGDYFIVFDSDCIIPEDYLENVRFALLKHSWDAFGGPDAAHPSFSIIQKAISYAMTSPLTTGGIRGNKKHIGPFYPRSFNMGISKHVWILTGGFKWTNQSEDIEFSRRMHTMGFKVGLVPEAIVYHKRRTSFWQFFRQIQGFGAGRVRLSRHFRDQLSWFHLAPAVFFAGNLLMIFLAVLIVVLPRQQPFYNLVGSLFFTGVVLLLMWMFGIFLDSWIKTRNFKVAVTGVVAGFVQLNAYGLGFLKAFFRIK